MIRATYAILLAAVLPLTTPAMAKQAGGWKQSGDRIAIPTADISFPKTAGTVVLVRTDEFSHKGEGLDNVAQYEAADRKLFATVYVYRPAYPDAALTAYETDRTIRARFGIDGAIDRSVVAAPGRPDTVIRLVYPDAKADKVNGGEPVATAAAFLRVSGWIVKLRVTGPAPRRAEALATLDALIAGIKVDRKAYIPPAAILQIVAPCPGADTAAALLPKDNKTMARALAAAMTSTVVTLDPSGKKDALRPPFPNNGLQTACVRGEFAYDDRTIELLQPAGSATPDTLLGVLSDDGAIMAIDKALVTPGYDFKVTQIGVANIYGSFDAIPSTTQIAALLSGKPAPGATRQASVKFAATGNSNIELVTD